MAHIYQQRPTLRQFIQLYANVASTAFVAGEIEDIDLEGLLGTIMGSGVAAFPGVQLLANSVVSGAANAFLTLRVGMIAKQYCMESPGRLFAAPPIPNLKVPQVWRRWAEQALAFMTNRNRSHKK